MVDSSWRPEYRLLVLKGTEKQDATLASLVDSSFRLALNYTRRSEKLALTDEKLLRLSSTTLEVFLVSHPI